MPFTFTRKVVAVNNHPKGALMEGNHFFMRAFDFPREVKFPRESDFPW